MQVGWLKFASQYKWNDWGKHTAFTKLSIHFLPARTEGFPRRSLTGFLQMSYSSNVPALLRVGLKSFQRPLRKPHSA